MDLPGRISASKRPAHDLRQSRSGATIRSADRSRSKSSKPSTSGGFSIATETREEAARILGIDPSTLYRKRKQLGSPKPTPRIAGLGRCLAECKTGTFVPCMMHERIDADLFSSCSVKHRLHNSQRLPMYVRVLARALLTDRLFSGNSLIFNKLRMKLTMGFLPLWPL